MLHNYFNTFYRYCQIFITNKIIVPIRVTKNPTIFSPKEPSFWSPNPKNFFVIIRASYIKITPRRTNNRPIIFNINIPIFLHPFIFIVHLYYSFFIKKSIGDANAPPITFRLYNCSFKYSIIAST